MNIEITAWREMGDDEDRLDVRLAEEGENVHLAIANEYDIHYDADDIEDGEADLVVVNSSIIKSGEVWERGDKKYRITIEEVV